MQFTPELLLANAAAWARRAEDDAVERFYADDDAIEGQNLSLDADGRLVIGYVRRGVVPGAAHVFY